MICTINHDDVGSDGEGNPNDPNEIELMILLDEESQQKLLAVNLRLEELMWSKGLIVNVPRQQNIGFHITLANVHQIEFPVNSKVEEINKAIDWSSISMEMFQNEPVCPGFPADKENIWNFTCIG